jgi:hypothetical protein
VSVELIKNVISDCRLDFRGDDPGWPWLDQCQQCLTRLIRSLALMILIKNLGHHSLPPLNRIWSRDSKIQGRSRGGWFSKISELPWGGIRDVIVSWRVWPSSIQGRSIRVVQGDKSWGAFAGSLLAGATRKYDEINWYRDIRTILLTCYLTCEFGWCWLVTLQCKDF